MNNTNIKTILKHPFTGTSLNLIETFLIVGYDTNEIQLSLEEANKLIDDVAKRILDEYHDAFTELAKGPDT